MFPTGPLVLLLDTDASHRTAMTKTIASIWGIELMSIRRRFTHRLQRLDRWIRGALRAHARELCRTYHHPTHGVKTTYSMIVQNLLTIWKHMSDEIMESPWAIVHNGWDIDDSVNSDDRMNDS
jgi:hypothetical protein